MANAKALFREADAEAKKPHNKRDQKAIEVLISKLEALQDERAVSQGFASRTEYEHGRDDIFDRCEFMLCELTQGAPPPR